MSVDDATRDVTSATSEVWSNHVPVPGTPEGFTARTAYPVNPNGVEVMLERWQAGTQEPPHSHPGDDMTVVVEGKIAVQFYRQEARTLVPDGERILLGKGDVGYIPQGFGHSIENISGEKARILIVFNNGHYQTIDVSQWIAGNPVDILATNFSQDPGIFKNFPRRDVFLTK